MARRTLSVDGRAGTRAAAAHRGSAISPAAVAALLIGLGLLAAWLITFPASPGHPSQSGTHAVSCLHGNAVPGHAHLTHEEAFGYSKVTCSQCGLRHDANRVRVVDGRRLCPGCYARMLKARNQEATAAVKAKRPAGTTTSRSSSGLTQEKAEQLARRVMGTMSGLDLPVRHHVHIELSGHRMSVRTNEGGLGGTIAGAVGKFRRVGDRFEIHLIRDVSTGKAIRILAHELGHAYYEENFRRFKSRLYREGFSEWVAYKVLEQRKAYREMHGMLKRRDVYGDGLRTMLEAEKRGGVEEVLQVAMDGRREQGTQYVTRTSSGG